MPTLKTRLALSMIIKKKKKGKKEKTLDIYMEKFIIKIFACDNESELCSR
jgi:hypothetical protein